MLASWKSIRKEKCKKAARAPAMRNNRRPEFDVNS